MKAFILSAGLGTRLRSLTNDRPKVMVEIGGKPVLEHLIGLCRYHGINDIVLNLHYLPRPVKEYFGNGEKFGVKIAYSFEKEKIMGGAGALKLAKSLLSKGPFFVLNGDVMTNIDLTAMAKFHQEKGGLGTFLVHETNHPYDSDLVEIDENSRILRFFRPKPGDQFKPISKSGTHLFNSKVLEFIPEGVEYSLENQLIPDLLKRGEKLYGFYSQAYSKDMGTPERLEQVKKDYEAGKIAF